MIRSLVVTILLAACSSPVASTPATLTLKGGDNGLVQLAGGRYHVTWTADCSDFFLEVAPTSRAPAIEIPAALPSGSADVDLPAGPAYINRGGICTGDYVVTLTPGAAPAG